MGVTAARSRAPRYTFCVAAQIVEDPSEAQVELATATLKLLADGTRLRILWALLHGEHSVNELASHLGAQAPAVSQHLAKLRLARLVKVRRQGNRKFYATNDVHIACLVEEALFHAEGVVEINGTDQAPGGETRSTGAGRAQTR